MSPKNLKAKENTIDCQVLLVIKEDAGEKGEWGTDIRVVRWIINGKPTGQPSLEKRTWKNFDGKGKRFGKAKGFTVEEMDLIFSKFDAIKKVLKSS